MNCLCFLDPNTFKDFLLFAFKQFPMIYLQGVPLNLSCLGFIEIFEVWLHGFHQICKIHTQYLSKHCSGTILSSFSISGIQFFVHWIFTIYPTYLFYFFLYLALFVSMFLYRYFLQTYLPVIFDLSSAIYNLLLSPSITVLIYFFKFILLFFSITFF